MYGERSTSHPIHPAAAAMKTAPKMVALATVFIAGWKIWPIFLAVTLDRKDT
jgi:hypothetical protein